MLWHARHECLARKLPLVVDLRERVVVLINLYDRVGVDAVNLAVRAFADHLAPVYAQLAVGLGDGHHLGEAGHVENLIDVGGSVDDLRVRVRFFQTQNDAQTGAGNIGELCRVEDPCAGKAGGGASNRFFRFGGVGGINPAIQKEDQTVIFVFC